MIIYILIKLFISRSKKLKSQAKEKDLQNQLVWQLITITIIILIILITVLSQYNLLMLKALF